MASALFTEITDPAERLSKLLENALLTGEQLRIDVGQAMTDESGQPVQWPDIFNQLQYMISAVRAAAEIDRATRG